MAYHTPRFAQTSSLERSRRQSPKNSSDVFRKGPDEPSPFWQNPPQSMGQEEDAEPVPRLCVVDEAGQDAPSAGLSDMGISE